MEFLKGAKETICTQKPAMLLSIYHQASDYFGIKPLIESWNLGYKFKIHKGVDLNIIVETALFCEILEWDLLIDFYFKCCFISLWLNHHYCEQIKMNLSLQNFDLNAKSWQILLYFTFCNVRNLGRNLFCCLNKTKFLQNLLTF